MSKAHVSWLDEPAAILHLKLAADAARVMVLLIQIAGAGLTRGRKGEAIVRGREMLLVVVLLVAGLTWEASATPGSGVERENLATGSVVQGGSVDIAEQTGVVADAVTVAPGGTSGWHTHPAPELVLVKSGELTFYRSDMPDCGARTFRAGDAFVGPPGGVPQMATNTGDVPTEVVVAFFGIGHDGVVRHDADVPADCPAK